VFWTKRANARNVQSPSNSLQKGENVLFVVRDIQGSFTVQLAVSKSELQVFFLLRDIAWTARIEKKAKHLQLLH
jgi:hypothetical protein